jgi:serine-type D-Ala-D-Ala carboxypeptidase (penicillin-binding protein 5/6)
MVVVSTIALMIVTAAAADATTATTAVVVVVHEAAVPAELGAVVGRSWLLMDAKTGKVLASKNAHDPQLAASTVKMVTALTALRTLGTKANVKVSNNAAGRPPMRIGMRPGERWRIGDALHSMMMVSANDAAYALAETSGGSLKGFVKQMNATGTKLGLKDSTFGDPAGFDGADTNMEATKMSSYDLALVGRAVLNSPTLSKIVRTVTYDFTGPDGDKHHLVNHNRALNPKRERFYDGTVGIKTGYTKAAQGTYVTAAKRGDRTLIAVVMGNQDIYTPTSLLLDWGFGVPRPAATTTTRP